MLALASTQFGNLSTFIFVYEEVKLEVTKQDRFTTCFKTCGTGSLF